MEDWLFVRDPALTLEEQEEQAQRLLATDPAAAAIGDEEAEAFAATAIVVRNLNPLSAGNLFRKFGVSSSTYRGAPARLAVLRVLRRWKDKRSRQYLAGLVEAAQAKGIPDTRQRKLWDDATFQSVFDAGVHITILAYWRRDARGPEGTEEWLESLGELVPRHYRLWLTVSKLTLSRLVYRQAQPVAQAAAATLELSSLQAEVRSVSTASERLRREVRMAERHRRQAEADLRHQRQAAANDLKQALGDVEAVRRQLADRLREHQRELQRMQRQHEGMLVGRRAQADSERAACAGTLRHAAQNHSAPFLRGMAIAVTGPLADQPICRLLVETLGGRLVAGRAHATCSAEGGVAEFERQLRRLALRRVVITCDGLFRRREGQMGVAVSGVQVRYRDVPALTTSRLVCCGPTTGSLMAEYGAMLLALHWADRADLPPGAQVEIRSDCKALLGRLARGDLARRKTGCVALHRAVCQLLASLRRRGYHVEVRWVPRSQVHLVDRLCYRTYRALPWYHRRGARVQRRALAVFLSDIARNAPMLSLSVPTGTYARSAPFLPAQTSVVH